MALMSLGVLSGAATAATTVMTDCADLQSNLNTAADGDTIILTGHGLCTGDFSLSNSGSDPRSLTLEGQPGSGAGFDGTGATTSMLHTIPGAGGPTTTMTVRNLVFENAPAAPARNGGALAIQGDYSVTLDGDTFTNNQVGSGGSGGAVDIETGANSADVTLTNDTFTDNQSTGTGGAASGGAANLAISGSSGAITLSGDTFTHNQTAGGGSGGAVEVAPSTNDTTLAVTNSTFASNSTQTSGGGLDVLELAGPTTLRGNVFANNTVAGCGSSCELDGGGVSIVDVSSGGNTVTQSGNSFTGNSVVGGTEEVNGGGESVIGERLNSTGDVFTGNSLQAPPSGKVSDGSALGIEHNCTATNPQDVANNLAIAGNSIGDGGDTTGANGALSVSCAFGSSGNPNSLQLNDSTISGNRGGGGTAGIWGDSGDQLTLQNSILNGDSDGVELTGFSGGGGSTTVTHTDLCNGSSPFTGTANICADPKLAGASSGDVHETFSSPTVDAGSNSLVPNGLTTDVYGASRIQPRLSGGTATVDMGAAELNTVPPPSASITTPASRATYTVGQTATSSFSCTEGSGGPGISSCVDQNGQSSGRSVDTSTAGSHTFTVTATSSDGLTGTASVSYTVTPKPPSVSITTPRAGARYRFGQRVLARFRCTEGSGGPGIASCKGAVANGAAIDTSPPGRHTFTVKATSSDGRATTRSVRYTVLRPTNKLVKQPRLKPHSDGRFIVTVKVPHPGRVDILVTAWKDNFAAADLPAPRPVSLQPAIGRFVFARAYAIATRATTLHILVRPNARGRLLVANHRYRVTLRLWVSYTPAGGHPGKIGYYGLHLP